MKLESAITKEITRLQSEYEGVHFLKVHGGAMQRRGEPDLIVCVHGQFVAMEVKRPGRKPTDLQTRRLNQWSEAGAISCVVTSKQEARKVIEDAINHRS